MLMVAAVSRTVHLAQRAAQRLDFPLIEVLLSFENLQHLEYFFHVVKRTPKGLNNSINFLDCFLD